MLIERLVATRLQHQLTCSPCRARVGAALRWILFNQTRPSNASVVTCCGKAMFKDHCRRNSKQIASDCSTYSSLEILNHAALGFSSFWLRQQNLLPMLPHSVRIRMREPSCELVEYCGKQRSLYLETKYISVLRLWVSNCRLAWNPGFLETHQEVLKECGRAGGVKHSASIATEAISKPGHPGPSVNVVLNALTWDAAKTRRICTLARSQSSCHPQRQSRTCWSFKATSSWHRPQCDSDGNVKLVSPPPHAPAAP